MGFNFGTIIQKFKCSEKENLEVTIMFQMKFEKGNEQ